MSFAKNKFPGSGPPPSSPPAFSVSTLPQPRARAKPSLAPIAGNRKPAALAAFRSSSAQPYEQWRISEIYDLRIQKWTEECIPL